MLMHFTYLLHEAAAFLTANRSSTSQDIPLIIWNPKVHYRTYKCPLPVPNLSTALHCQYLMYALQDTIKVEVLQFTVNIMAHLCTLTSLTLLNFVLYNMKCAIMPCECGEIRIHPRHSYMRVSPKGKVWLGELIDQTIGHDAFTEKDKSLIAPFTLICCKNSQSYKWMDYQTSSVSRQCDALPHYRHHVVL
jgi:hypothetical protein